MRTRRKFITMGKGAIFIMNIFTYKHKNQNYREKLKNKKKQNTENRKFVWELYVKNSLVTYYNIYFVCFGYYIIIIIIISMAVRPLWKFFSIKMQFVFFGFKFIKKKEKYNNNFDDEFYFILFVCAEKIILSIRQSTFVGFHKRIAVIL